MGDAVLDAELAIGAYEVLMRQVRRSASSEGQGRQATRSSSSQHPSTPSVWPRQCLRRDRWVTGQGAKRYS